MITPEEQRYAKARAAWPGVELPRDAFDAWLSERAAAAPGDAHSEELYLACACARGDSRAIQLFEQRYFRGVLRSVARFDVPVEDIEAALRERLFVRTSQGSPKISEYAGRGGLERWLRAVAVRIALSLARSQQRLGYATLLEDDFIAGDDPELAHIKERYRAEFKQAFAGALAALEPELQTYLRLYYLDGLNLAELAELFHVSVPTASRRISGARERVLEGTRRILQDRLAIDAQELESIMRLIQSRLSVAFQLPEKP